MKIKKAPVLVTKRTAHNTNKFDKLYAPSFDTGNIVKYSRWFELLCTNDSIYVYSRKSNFDSFLQAFSKMSSLYACLSTCTYSVDFPQNEHWFRSFYMYT